MNDVEAHAYRIITTNRASGRVPRLGRAHQGAGNGNDVGAFQHTHDNWAGRDVLDQAGVERLAFVLGLVARGQFWRDVDELEANNLEALRLEAREHLANQPALYAFGLDDDERSLHGGLSSN